VLVFTRRRGETIMIGDGIEVRVLRSGRDGVRLGIVAPMHVPVHRQEVYEQIRQANRSAAEAPGALATLAERLRRGTEPRGEGRKEQKDLASARATASRKRS
jgi:carbon storage regulator